MKLEREGPPDKKKSLEKIQYMKLEGRSTRLEILKSTVDEIRGKVYQTRNLKKYCR